MGKINIVSGERRSREPAIGMGRTKIIGVVIGVIK